MIDLRIAELRQARELLFEFAAIAKQESGELEAFLSSREPKTPRTNLKRIRAVSPPATELEPASTPSPSTNHEVGTAEEFLPLLALIDSNPIGPNAHSALRRPVPAGPVVVPPKDLPAGKATDSPTPTASSALEALAREVAVRTGVNPLGKSSLYPN